MFTWNQNPAIKPNPNISLIFKPHPQFFNKFPIDMGVAKENVKELWLW